MSNISDPNSNNINETIAQIKQYGNEVWSCDIKRLRMSDQKYPQ